MPQPSAIANYPVGSPEFEIVVNRMREGVVGLDTRGRICLSNLTAAAMLALELPAAFGMDFETAVPHPELHALLQTARGLSGPRMERQVSVARAGGPRLIEVVIHTLDAADDQPIRQLMFLNDVSEMARSARMKADFVANASHELRTPLSTLQAAAETLLASAPQFDAHQRRFLEVITKNVARLSDLAQDLLELNRAESPTLPVHPQQTAIMPILEELHRDHAARMADRGIEMVFNLAVFSVHADPKLLKVIVANLIDNAVKFVRPHEGRIQVRSGHGGDHTWLEVADNGVGIPPEDQQRIFERFYQVDRARKETGASGTGLGLAIVKHAAASMGGRLSLNSTPDQGTAIRVLLPQPDPDPSPAGRGPSRSFASNPPCES